MSDYLEVLVGAAKSISDIYKKQAVVILSWDEEHQVVHTTTYGIELVNKFRAANWGEICTTAIVDQLRHFKREIENLRADVDRFHKERQELRTILGAGGMDFEGDSLLVSAQKAMAEIIKLRSMETKWKKSLDWSEQARLEWLKEFDGYRKRIAELEGFMNRALHDQTPGLLCKPDCPRCAYEKTK